MVRVFIAGSVHAAGCSDSEQVCQDYRERIREQTVRLGGEVVDPMPASGWELENVSPAEARRSFQRILGQISTVDIVIAFIETPSMGTSVEIYEAARLGIPVVVITALRRWVIMAFETKTYRSLSDYLETVEKSGSLERFLDSISSHTAD